jgi:ubiquitin-like 1-activating enzyme E1 A
VNKPFYAASAHGFYGFIFTDLIRHEYVVERDLSNMGTLLGPEPGSATRSVINVDVRTENGKRMERVTKEEIYSSMDAAAKGPLPTSIKNLRRRMRAVSPLLSCFRALWEMEHKRFLDQAPLTVSASDFREFTTVATRKHAVLGLSEDSLTAELIRKFTENIGSQIAPVTAILGGLVAQDVINVIGRREQPIQNLAIFDGESFQVPVYAMHDEGFGKYATANGTKGTNGHGNMTSSSEPEIIEL